MDGTWDAPSDPSSSNGLRPSENGEIGTRCKSDDRIKALLSHLLDPEGRCSRARAAEPICRERREEMSDAQLLVLKRAYWTHATPPETPL